MLEEFLMPNNTPVNQETCNRIRHPVPRTFFTATDSILGHGSEVVNPGSGNSEVRLGVHQASLNQLDQRICHRNDHQYIQALRKRQAECQLEGLPGEITETCKDNRL